MRCGAEAAVIRAIAAVLLLGVRAVCQVVSMDVAPLAPFDASSPYASPRDAARHRLQVTMSQLQATRNVRAAMQGFADAFAADRTYAIAAFNLGIVAAIAEKWTDALAAFEEASRLDPALGKVAVPTVERLRKIAAMESTPDGKLRRAYDEALFPVMSKLSMREIAGVGRIDPKRWEAPALLASLSGDDRGYETAVQFLAIAAKNATDAGVKARLEQALGMARREQAYGAARTEADAAADGGEYEKAAVLYEKAWSAMPARSSNGMEAASAWLLHDDTVHATVALARLRESGDPELGPLAGAMLTELEAVEPAAKTPVPGARDFFRDAGSAQPVVLSDVIPAVDTAAMEVLARPLPKLATDAEPVVLLAALSANPADPAAGGTLPQLGPPSPAAPAVREIPGVGMSADAAGGSARATSTADISPVAKTHRAILVTSTPAGARIFNGDSPEPACETPCTIQAEPGKYNLRFFLAGYAFEERQVEVAAKSVELAVQLKQTRASVLVDAPADAVLKVNGTPVPNPAPVELSLLPGLHKITAEIGGAVRERTLNLKPEARLRIEFKP
jgi:tetratricopeptide (TPR) repeat protein